MTDVMRIRFYKGPDQLGRYYFSYWECRDGMYYPLPDDTGEFPVGYCRRPFFFSDLMEHIASRRHIEWLERMGHPAESHAIDPVREAIEVFEDPISIYVYEKEQWPPSAPSI